MKIIKLEKVLSFAIVEGFLLYGVFSAVCEQIWPKSGMYWSLFLNIIYMLVMVKVILQKNNRIQWVLIIGLLGLAEITRITTQTNAVRWFVSGIIIAKNLDLDKILRDDLITRLVIGGCLIVLPLFGLYPNHADSLIGGRLRDSFGWAHPNEMGLFFLMISIVWLYFRHRNWNWKDTVGMLLLVGFLDYFPNSRTSEICILGIIFLEGIIFILNKKRIAIQGRVRIWTFCAVIALVAGCAIILSLIIVIDSGSAWLSIFPDTVSSRLILAHNFWKVEGFSVLGQIFDYEKYIYLDIMYAYLSLNLGMVVLGLFFALNIISIWEAFKRNDEKMLLILFVLLIYSLLEHEHFKMISGFYPILLGQPLWNMILDKFCCKGKEI